MVEEPVDTEIDRQRPDSSGEAAEIGAAKEDRERDETDKTIYVSDGLEGFKPRQGARLRPVQRVKEEQEGGDAEFSRQLRGG